MLLCVVVDNSWKMVSKRRWMVGVMVGAVEGMVGGIADHLHVPSRQNQFRIVIQQAKACLMIRKG